MDFCLCIKMIPEGKKNLTMMLNLRFDDVKSGFFDGKAPKKREKQKSSLDCSTLFALSYLRPSQGVNSELGKSP